MPLVAMLCAERWAACSDASPASLLLCAPAAPLWRTGRRYKEEIQEQKGEGCHIWGELKINKVRIRAGMAGTVNGSCEPASWRLACPLLHAIIVPGPPWAGPC